MKEMATETVRDKDGKIKNSYPFEIDLNIIFSDIDRMPMRKYEMGKQNKK